MSLYRRPHYRRLLLPSKSCHRTRPSGRRQHQVARPASRNPPRRLRDPSRHLCRSSRCNARGRATTLGHRSSAFAVAELFAEPRSRQLNFGRKGFGAISRRLVPAIVPILGWLGQELDRIGANGFMVLRLRVESKRDAGACSLQRRARESCVTPQKLLVNKLLFTLRRPQGATGRYRGPTGAAWAAAGVPRRPRDGSDAFPGGRKGLSSLCYVELPG